MITWRNMVSAGVPAEMAPVPRVLSTDCGTCVRYTAETPRAELLHPDFDQVAEVTEQGAYQTVVKNNADE